MTTHTTRWAALTTAGLLALTACSGGADSGGSEQATVQSDSAGSEAKSVAEATDAADATTEQQDSTDISSPTHLARTAALTITVDDVGRASARVRTTATSAGGYVSSEETHIGPEEPDSSPSSPDRAWAQMVITVPVAELDRTLTALSKLGTVPQRTGTTDDLTDQYTDTASRVRTLEKSVKRLQELIDSAAGLEEIVALEEQLTQREADLEAMVSKKKSLEKRTSTVPITVSLQTPADAEEMEEDGGFLAGLAAGWDAFSDAFTVGMTALGALTPFAIVAVVVLTPLAMWLRRRRAGVSAR